MSRKEGNPGYDIAHKCQEKREIQDMPLLTNVKKREISGYGIAHKCQEKKEIQIKSLLTNVKKRLLANVKKRGKSWLCHCLQMSRKEGNLGYAIARKCQEKREIQIM